MAGTTRVLNFSEGASVAAPAQTFLSTTEFQTFASDAAYVTAKGSAATEGNAYGNTSDNHIHYYDGTVWRVVENTKNNFSATTAPTISDDNTVFYSIGSVWINLTTDLIYVATDVTTGAAVWKEQIDISANQTIGGTKTFSGPLLVSDTTQSTTKDTGALIIEGGLGVEKNAFIGGNLEVAGDMTIQGTTITLNTATLDVEDSNITVNKGGTVSSANTAVAGITVDTDATDARIGYDSTLASKFKAGNVGSESEVITATATQSISNKALQDSTTTIADNADPTKQAKFEASSIATGTTRTMTIPDEDFTIQPKRLTTKGDLLTYSTTDNRIGIGTDGFVLTADSTQANGLKWAVVSASAANYVVQTKTTTYTVLTTDDIILGDTSGGIWTLTIYTPVGNSGKQIRVKKTTADFNALTITPAAGSIAENGTTTASTTINTKDEDLILVSDNVNWHVLNRKTTCQSTAYTPTGTWSANTTYTGYWRRFADCIFIEVNVAITGTPTTASLRVSIPSGLTIDTGKLSSMAGTESMMGMCYIQDAGVQKYPPAKLEYFNTTTMALYYNPTATTEAAITQAAPFTFANGDNIKLTSFAIPITGWKA